MSHFPGPGLDPSTERGLQKYQEEADRVESCAAPVETGKNLFERSRPQPPADGRWSEAGTIRAAAPRR